MRKTESNQDFEKANSPYKRRKVDQGLNIGAINTESDPRLRDP